MFGLSPEAIQGHGLAPFIAEQFSVWREIAGKLSPEQRKQISASYYHDTTPHALDAGHPIGKTIFEARKTSAGFEVQPFCIMVRGKEDLEWKTVQEFGPVLPRQYVLPGTRLRLENTLPRQAPQFIIRVMNGLVEGLAKSEGGSAETNKDVAGYLAGAGAKPQAPPSAAKPTTPDVLDNKLQPTASQIQAPGRHQFTDEGTALRIALDNSQQEEYFQLDGLPNYRMKGNSQNARGLALTVT
jgi:hypothetical protein